MISRKMCRFPQAFVAIIGVGVLIPTVFLVIPDYWRAVGRDIKGRQVTNLQVSVLPRLNMVKSENQPSDDRSFHMDKYCNKLQKQLHEEKVKISQFKHMIYDDHYKTLYCQIPKVATTNWRRMFLILSGKMNTSDPSKLRADHVHQLYDNHINYLSDLDPQEIQYRLKNYFKFVIVREPFERLLSAYRNKFASSTKSGAYFHQRFGRHIIKKFRVNATKESQVRGHDVTFSEFVQYILDPERKEPLNEHWAEYHSLCLPCIVNYDYIGKYESLMEDSSAIIEKMKASDVLTFPARSSTYHYETTNSLMYDYYKELSPIDLLQLWKLFYPDFVLFNYTLPKSLQNLTNLASIW